MLIKVHKETQKSKWHNGIIDIDAITVSEYENLKQHFCSTEGRK